MQLYRAGKYAEAASAWESLAADLAADTAQDDSIAAANFLTNAAACKMELGLYRGAQKQAEKAIAHASYHLSAHVTRGLALRSLKKPAKATKAWRAGIDAATDRSDVAALQELERLLLDENAPAAGPPPAPPSTARGPRSPQADMSMEVAAAPVRETSREVERWAETAVPQDILERARGAVAHRTGHAAVDDAIATGYLLVNTGRLDQAITAFDGLLRTNPRLVAALLGRGSARALREDLEGSLEDFDAAVAAAPHITDCYKRRGQTLAALGRLEDALRDLDAAVAIEEQGASDFDADLYHQRGAVHHRLQDYRTAAQDFALALQRDREGPRASQRPRAEAARTWNMRGLCEAQLGLVGCHDAFARSLELDATSRETWLNLGQAARDRGDGDAARRAFRRCVDTDPAFCRAHHAFGLYAYGVGAFGEAQKHFAACVARAQSRDPDDAAAAVGALHYAGLCCSARGDFEKAEGYFGRALGRDPEHVCWYARELGRFYGATLDDPDADAEADITGTFKEGHCKRHGIALVAAAAPSEGRGTRAAAVSTKDVKAATAAWVRASKRFEDLVQLQKCPGFLNNERHHRMFGLSVLHAAHFCKQAFAGEAVTWRQVYEVAVRWRREAEPGDAVWWIDQLPRRAFAEGFGLHTPMQSGLLKVVRYAKYIPAALDVVKDTLRRNLPEGEADLRKTINEACTLQAVHALCNHRDFWCTAPCASERSPGVDLGGTRITLQAKPFGGFDFSIRTPGTPARWALYDQELAFHWERLVEEVRAGDRDAILERAAKTFYYWCAFGPLSRGSAACGYAVLFGMLTAAGLGVPSSLPPGRQVDWEAILAPTAAGFADGVRPWLADATAAAAPGDLPPPSEAFATLRDRLGALNL